MSTQEPKRASSPPPSPKTRRRRAPHRASSSAEASRSVASFWSRFWKQQSRRRRAIVLALLGALGAISIALLVLVFGFGHWHAPDEGAAVEVDLPSGLSSEEAAALLAHYGLVRSEGAMLMFLRTTGGTSSFVPGPHLLSPGLDPWDLRHLLERSPRRPSAKVTIPEGFHRFDIATRLEKLRVVGKNAFLRASREPMLLDELGIEHAGAVGAESAEGYLFPATYDFPLDSDPREVLRRFVLESDRRWASLAAQHQNGLASLRSSLGWGRREVLILASIVEKEAAVSEERPLIASVFLNRLLDPTFKPKRLQSDPTGTYACFLEPDVVPACAGFSGKVTPSILRDSKNRYSTYVIDGLPPGPISNPGTSSIEAVLAPASTKALYFVAKGGGRHTFSETLEQHNEAVRRLRASSSGSE